jgi:hypothetical protein
MKNNIKVIQSSSNPNFINFCGTAKEFSKIENSSQEGNLADLFLNYIIIEEVEVNEDFEIINDLVIEKNNTSDFSRQILDKHLDKYENVWKALS